MSLYLSTLISLKFAQHGSRSRANNWLHALPVVTLSPCAYVCVHIYVETKGCPKSGL
jgi:hypothetical protein